MHFTSTIISTTLALTLATLISLANPSSFAVEAARAKHAMYAVTVYTSCFAPGTANGPREERINLLTAMSVENKQGVVVKEDWWRKRMMCGATGNLATIRKFPTVDVTNPWYVAAAFCLLCEFMFTFPCSRKLTHAHSKIKLFLTPESLPDRITRMTLQYTLTSYPLGRTQEFTDSARFRTIERASSGAWVVTWDMCAVVARTPARVRVLSSA
jgi:hypothetical protein